jgi:hypothetical protein
LVKNVYNESTENIPESIIITILANLNLSLPVKIFENTIVPNIPNTIMKIMNSKTLSLNLTISVELFNASNITQIHQTATNI